MSRTLFSDFRWWQNGELQQMLVEEGRVVARGPDVQAVEATVVDLGGQTLLPALIDSHCHILPTGLDLKKLHLGGCATAQDMLDAVEARHKELPPDAWLLAVHYDQNRLPGGQHLTRHALDAVVSDRPVVLRHWNGHAGVANTEALRRAEITKDTPDPKGGTFVREGDGTPSGALLELALEQVMSAAPMPTVEQMADAIVEAGKSMARYGIACASDMMTGSFDLERELEAYALAFERGCPIRIRLYVQWARVLGARAENSELLGAFQKRVPSEKGRIAGLKIFADGAIGSATAGIYGRFLTTQGDQQNDGQLIYAPERLADMIRKGHGAGYAIAIHSIGDRSTDHVLDAFEKLDDPSRHRIEHAMLLSDAQIARIARLGCRLTMQPEFLAHFGNAYERQLSAERLRAFKRFRSVSDAGICLALNSDRPITPGDPWVGIRTAMNRPERFDPAENLLFFEAVDGYLSAASRVNGDGRQMGSLEPGSHADFNLYEGPIVEGDTPTLVSRWMNGEAVPV